MPAVDRPDEDRRRACKRLIILGILREPTLDARKRVEYGAAPADPKHP
jgi:hypothetical protein